MSKRINERVNVCKFSKICTTRRSLEDKLQSTLMDLHLFGVQPLLALCNLHCTRFTIHDSVLQLTLCTHIAYCLQLLLMYSIICSASESYLYHLWRDFLGMNPKVKAKEILLTVGCRWSSLNYDWISCYSQIIQHFGLLLMMNMCWQTWFQCKQNNFKCISIVNKESL